MQASRAFSPVPMERAAVATRVAGVLAILGLLALSVVLVAGEIGRMLASAGHTESLVEREIVVGNDVFLVPENAIRFEKTRYDGVQPRLDLYLAWPGLEGYSRATSDIFNNRGGSGSVLFVTLAPRASPYDMSGRLDPVYRYLLAPGGTEGPAGLVFYRFRQEADQANEVLAVGERPGKAPFVARCLSGEEAASSLAPCMRDVLLTDETEVSYRFPETLLAHWREMDDAVMARMAAYLQTAD